MKPRSRSSRTNHGPEFKGVVKKITGRLTDDPSLEEEGRKEMFGGRKAPGKDREKSAGHKNREIDPDPYRRS